MRKPLEPELVPPLPLDFYLKPTPQVARELLGKGLVVRCRNQILIVEIVETEAYLQTDPASHSFCGTRKRNAVMFGPPGCCYVYLSYGLNFCMNVVTQAEGCGEAVLLRAAAPVSGLEIMARNREIKGITQKKPALSGPLKKSTPSRVFQILSGPGKLTQALGLDLRYNGGCFNRDDFKLINLNKDYTDAQVGQSPRVGISKAKTKLLRFYVKSSPWLSRKG
jgi:DNA-3-methyladenine glycosylase